MPCGALFQEQQASAFWGLQAHVPGSDRCPHTCPPCVPPHACLPLSACRCVVLGGDEDEGSVQVTPLGRIASFYYLQHTTMRQLAHSMGPGMDVQQLLFVSALQGGAGGRGNGAWGAYTVDGGRGMKGRRHARPCMRHHRHARTKTRGL